MDRYVHNVLISRKLQYPTTRWSWRCWLLQFLLYFQIQNMQKLMKSSHYIKIFFCSTNIQHHFCHMVLCTLKVLVTMILKITDFWYVMPCSMVGALTCQRILLPPASGYTLLSAHFYQITWHHNPIDSNHPPTWFCYSTILVYRLIY
jgi:hypothetical protein